MPLTRTEKTLAGLVIGALIGAAAGAVLGKTSPLFNLPEDQTSRGFNEQNFATAIEAGASIGGFSGAVIGLAA